MMIFRSYIVQFIGVVAILLSAVACKKERALSDEELAMVFRDAFLSNAYTMNQGIQLDSLRLYEPIFQSYGYTIADVQYTIGSFSTRKSARLSDVVERAIDMLEDVGKELDYQVAILDTIDNIAVRHTIRTIYQDSLIEMRSMRDTSKFQFTFEDLDPGNYSVNFDYLIDTLDETSSSYLSRIWVEDMGREVEKGHKPTRLRQKNTILTREKIVHYQGEFTISDTMEIARLELVDPSSKKGTPHLTIKRFIIKNRLSNEDARDSLFRKYCNIRIFDDELLFPRKNPQDSL